MINLKFFQKQKNKEYINKLKFSTKLIIITILSIFLELMKIKDK
jgi:hypothetical protein